MISAPTCRSLHEAVPEAETLYRLDPHCSLQAAAPAAGLPPGLSNGANGAAPRAVASTAAPGQPQELGFQALLDFDQQWDAKFGAGSKKSKVCTARSTRLCCESVRDLQSLVSDRIPSL